MALFLLTLFLGGLSTAQPTAVSSADKHCPVFYEQPPSDCRPVPETFLYTPSVTAAASVTAEDSLLEDAFAALSVLQDEYFKGDYGTWPSAIDWTAAVMGTIVSGMLNTLSNSLDSVELAGINDWKFKDNLISSFFAQIVGFYYGQDVFSIRGQVSVLQVLAACLIAVLIAAKAYDDILWVVLGWLETIKFVNLHTERHFSYGGGEAKLPSNGLRRALESLPWHGHSWVDSFAHRSRIFWNLGSRGWETRLCHGGMVWNPRITPYKNAITNELWISASISMYQNFPGDNFTAPWTVASVFPRNDPAHLAAAIEGYRWLMDVGMMNSMGLFADGFHVDRSKPFNVECDIRDEMVYTYNQGVILTGQRGLWAVSGSPSYLKDGHDLIQSVINATGWSLESSAPVDEASQRSPRQLPAWRGLGRGGILEEQCDASGTCSQDGQTFKGIFFHHLTAFCASLDPVHVERGVIVDVEGYQLVKNAHADACRSYVGWVRHNTLSALQTRDEEGRFGMWWGAGLFGNITVSQDDDGIDHKADNTTDYRNSGTPEDETWGGKERWLPGAQGWLAGQSSPVAWQSDSSQQILLDKQGINKHDGVGRLSASGSRSNDPNCRGRGRTAETQMGGLALLRAYWELSQTA